MKEQITKFDLEAAFKALNELEVPKVKGINANRMNISESVKPVDRTSLLLEDYYDISDNNDLEEASAARDAEVAKAKLARIEKIVDLDAETEEDILPSYVGKTIVQCPQCMTLFYRNPEDVIRSEEDETIVNVGEACPNCSHDAGFTIIGKVAADDEADEGAAEEVPTAEEPVDNAEASEETAAPETEAEDIESSEDTDLAPIDIPDADENTAEVTETEEPDDEEEKKEESFVKPQGESLTEAKEDGLDAKLKAHNDYIGYLQQMIKQEETSLKSENNEEVKAAIQRRIDAFKTDLEAALPEAVKTEVQSEDLPAADEVPAQAIANTEEEVAETKEDTKEETKESLTEAASNVCPKCGKEPCECETIEETACNECSESTEITEATNSGLPLGLTVDDFTAETAGYVRDRADKEILDDCKATLGAKQILACLIFAEQLQRSALVKQLKVELGKGIASDKIESMISQLETNSEIKAKVTASLKEADSKVECATNSNTTSSTLQEADEKEPVKETETSKDATEKLVFSDAEIDKMLDSDEFKTPVSAQEVDEYLADDLGESIDLSAIEDLNEQTFNNHLTKYFTEVYQNVDSFETTGCELTDKNLIVEGVINFKSGKQKTTKFEFKAISKNLLEGINADIAAENAFKLNYFVEDGGKTLMTESLAYNYAIDNAVVNGITK